jgi:parallel beta-helix repeat protein
VTRNPLKWICIVVPMLAACGEGAYPDEDGGATAGAAPGEARTESDTAAVAGTFCPRYVDSPLYRRRARTVVVGPADAWTAAIRGAAPGTEVLLRDGTYDMAGLYALTVPAEVTVRSQSGNAAAVVVRNGGNAVSSEGFMILGANVTLADLTIRDIRDHAVSVKGERGANSVQLYGLNVLDIGTQQIFATAGARSGLVACSTFADTAGRRHGDVVGAVSLHGVTGWSVRDNRVTGLVGDGTGCIVDRNCAVRPRGAALEVGDNSQNVVLERNRLLENWRGIGLGTGSGTIVRNNFVLRRAAGRTAVDLDGPVGVLIAHNTLRVAGHPNAVEARNAPGLSVVNNLTTGALRNLGAADLRARGNLTNAVDADFTQASDVHVRIGNRAIGAGVRLDTVVTDIDGDAFGGRWDVGADHGILPPPPPPPPTAPPTAAPTAPPTAPPVVVVPPPAPVVGGLDYCPPYAASPAYRARARQVVVGPGDAWMDTIERAATGTEVLLRDGTYLHTRYTVQIPAGVTVRGQSGNRGAVVIRGRGYGPDSEAFTFTGPDIAVVDLSMTQFRNHALSIKGELGAHTPLAYNLHLFDIGTDHIKVTPGGLRGGLVACSSVGYTTRAVGDYIDGIDIMGGIDWVIRDNTWYNIVGDGTGCEVDANCANAYVDGPAILIWRGSTGTVIERNVFTGNFRAINLGLGTPDDRSIVRNNFIYRTTAGDVGIGLQGATNTLVTGNTVLNGGYRAGIEVWSSQNVRLLNNLVSTPLWDRGGNTGLDARGNLWDATSADFMSPGDPHLRAGSHAIGAGVLVDTPADFDGEPFNGRFDVGCDHFGG